MDGQPAAQAKVLVDGKEIGATDSGGTFTKIIRKKPGADVEVMVSKEQAGYRIQPWKGTFLMKLPKGAPDKYAFEAELSVSRYVTIVVTEKGTPIPDAVVKAYGKEAGKTDAKGEFIYEYKDLPKGGVDLAVGKSGFSTWRKTGAVEPGQRFEAALSKRALIVVTALREEYGQTSGVAGVTVSIDKKPVGKTDGKGNYTYSYDGEPGKNPVLPVRSRIHPRRLEGRSCAGRRGQYPALFLPRHSQGHQDRHLPVRGQHARRGPEGRVAQTEQSLATQLFKYSAFKEVQSKTLQAEIKQAKVNIEKIIEGLA